VVVVGFTFGQIKEPSVVWWLVSFSCIGAFSDVAWAVECGLIFVGFSCFSILPFCKILRMSSPQLSNVLSTYRQSRVCGWPTVMFEWVCMPDFTVQFTHKLSHIGNQHYIDYQREIVLRIICVLHADSAIFQFCTNQLFGKIYGRVQEWWRFALGRQDMRIMHTKWAPASLKINSRNPTNFTHRREHSCLDTAMVKFQECELRSYPFVEWKVCGSQWLEICVWVSCCRMRPLGISYAPVRCIDAIVKGT